LISQVKSFIDTHQNDSIKQSTVLTQNFQVYLKRSSQIQKDKAVSDKVFSFSFSKPYVITNYIPNTQIE
jgi:hypothetical protein